MSDMSAYREAYLEELDEQLQTLEEEILRLEQDGASEGSIQRMFRAAHTLKGSSAAMGFEKMKTLTHGMEHRLDHIRNHKTQVSNSLINIFFACIDRMKLLQTEIMNNDREESEIGDLVRQLESPSLEGETPAPGAVPSGRTTKAQIPDEVVSTLQDALPGHRHVLRIDVRLADDTLMKQARLYTVQAQLEQLGTVVWASVDWHVEQPDEDCGAAAWLLDASADVADIRQFLDAYPDIASLDIEVFQPRTVQSEGQAITDDPHTPKQTAADRGPSAPRTSSIRVNVDRLEHLVNFVGELVIEQTRIQQVEKQFQQKYGSEKLSDELSSIADHLNRIVGEIQESVMQLRMLPIEQLFNRFPRMVRDLAQSLHKEVELVLSGMETELDRSLIEEIGDPLIHLIRNALDHGIEPPDVRRAAGKSPKGVLHIEAGHEDNAVMIKVRDDGAGIDTDKLVRAAVAKGILTEDEASRLSGKEAEQLIFHPGFSTAEHVSDISGRGVGMDIVRTDIERLNGMIEIETERGKGTAFVIKLPLTLAIITGLLVGVSRRVFILPMSNVVEIVRITHEQVRTVRGMPVLNMRDQIIPLIWLHDYFQIPRTDPDGRQYLQVVIIGRAEKKAAVIVDELLGNQEVVIKNLGSYIGKPDGINGATILGDGSVALILEVGGIIKSVNRS